MAALSSSRQMLIIISSICISREEGRECCCGNIQLSAQSISDESKTLARVRHQGMRGLSNGCSPAFNRRRDAFPPAFRENIYRALVKTLNASREEFRPRMPADRRRQRNLRANPVAFEIFQMHICPLCPLQRATPTPFPTERWPSETLIGSKGVSFLRPKRNERRTSVLAPQKRGQGRG